MKAERRHQLQSNELARQLETLPEKLQPLPGATTQPTLKLPRSSEEYLKSAADAYGDVVQRYANLPVPWVTAQFGLAAIAENRHDWEKAKQIYVEIQANQSVPDA